MQILVSDNKDDNTDQRLLELMDMNENMFMSYVLDNINNVKVPYTVEIETVNRCNNDCSFCPVNIKSDKREFHRMSDQLFYKIINELADLHYCGYISYFSNNEPLLDTRIADFIDYGREKLPFATHCLFTNGLLLSKKLYGRLVQSLDVLTIDNYDDDMLPKPNVLEIKEAEMDDRNCDVYVVIRKKTQILNTRGGLAPNKTSSYLAKSPCILPFTQMVIRPDGKVSRCCQDAYGTETLGDVSQTSVIEAWNSARMIGFRKMMASGGRGNHIYCAACDLFGLHNYTPRNIMNAYTDAMFAFLKDNHHTVFLSETIGDMKKLKGIFKENGKAVCSGAINTLQGTNGQCFYISGDYKDLEILESMSLAWKKDYFVYPIDYRDYQPRHKRQELIDRLRNAEKENHLVFYGGGRNALLLVQQYGFKPRTVIDNDRNKWNGISYLDGITVGSEGEAKIGKEKDVVLVTPVCCQDIKKHLSENGITWVDGSLLI